MTAAPILPALEALPKARHLQSGGWVACCPAHEDRSPSLAWTVADDGRALIACHAGCTAEAVVTALGLTLVDLFVPQEGARIVPDKPAPGPRSRARRFACTDADGRTWTHVRHEDATGRKVGPMPWEPAGAKVGRMHPYGSGDLAGLPDPVVMVEGEATAEAVRAAGFAAVGTFGIDYHPDPEALAPLAGRAVVMWPDADADPAKGRAAMLDMAARLRDIAGSLRWVEPPAGVFSGWDAADAGADRVRELVAAAGDVPRVRSGSPARPPTPAPRPGYTPADELAEAVECFRRWLHLPDPGSLYVVLATVAANRAEGDPVWLLVVGPPGGGKTEVLNPLGRLPDVYPAATLTEASLLSGTPGKDRAKDSKGGLLREIGDFGILVLKDFGSILSMNRDARAGVLAALREVYDGAWTRHVGTDGGRTLSWSGKVGLVAGCTPAIDSHHAVVGSMGERFVLYRLPPVEAEAQVRRAMAHVGHEAEMRAELGEAVARVLAAAPSQLLTAPPDEATVDRLVSISTLAVRCRSAVERDAYSREIVLIPEAEAPARLALVLLRLHNALLAIGVDEAETWLLLTKCALDSMPAIRRAVLEHLAARDEPATTAKVAEALDYPTTTTTRALQDLTAHGIVHRESQGPGKPDLWNLTTWTRNRWPGSSPEMSEGTGSEHGPEATTAPISIPIRVPTNKSGEVPPVEADLVATARGIFGDLIVEPATPDLHRDIWGDA